MHIPVKRTASARMTGFTLLELVITMALMAIIVSMAAPSFNRTIRDNRVLAQANSMIAGVANARSEAMRRGRMATICPSTDGASCGGTWQDGWIVYVEKTTVLTGAAPDPDTTIGVLLVGDATSENLQIVQQGGGNAWIRFSSRGLAEQAVTFDVKPGTCDTGYNYQELAFGITGRATLTKKTC